VQAVVGIVMGSSSDLEVMDGAVTILQRFGVETEVQVVSAHRTPEAMIEYGVNARGRGLQVLIAGAGGAAHLPGMLAAVTTLPVIGVPVALANLDGLDSLLSIAQMPRGVPVATVAVNGATNAGLLAARILSLGDVALATALDEYRQELAAQANQQNRDLPRSSRFS
jgi:5-(carboxyamino)imidazole ribonucleotide mutase